MKLVVTLLGILVIASCASKETTAEAQKKLDENWTPKIGVATKEELIEAFGQAQWCKQNDDGTETCRFYNKRGTVFIGDQKRDKKPHEKFDQLVADFGKDGVLKSYKGSAQR